MRAEPVTAFIWLSQKDILLNHLFDPLYIACYKQSSNIQCACLLFLHTFTCIRYMYNTNNVKKIIIQIR